MKIILEILGYVLLWAATDVGRTQDSKIKFMKGKWWLILGLIGGGTLLINNVDKWF